MEYFPQDVLYIIFTFSAIPRLHNCMAVCRGWYAIIAPNPQLFWDKYHQLRLRPGYDQGPLADVPHYDMRYSQDHKIVYCKKCENRFILSDYVGFGRRKLFKIFGKYCNCPPPRSWKLVNRRPICNRCDLICILTELEYNPCMSPGAICMGAYQYSLEI